MAMLNFIWKLAASEQRVRLGNIKQIFTAGIKLNSPDAFIQKQLFVCLRWKYKTIQISACVKRWTCNQANFLSKDLFYWNSILMVSFRFWFRVHVSCPRLRTGSLLEVNAWLYLYFILLNKLVPAFHKQI